MTNHQFHKNRHHTYPAWALTFMYTLAPLMFYSPPGTTTAQPPAEIVENLPTEENGQGGPSELLEYLTIETMDSESSFAQDLSPSPFTVSSSVEPEIYRINYFNYANARLPVDNPRTSSGFGWRTPPCQGCSADHRGVDFVPGRGKPVYAVLDGIVIEAGYLGGYGYWVKLEHLVHLGDGQTERWETVYAHLEEDSIPEDVKIGAVVKKSQIIGKVGNTGQSTGPHLHFELRIEGEQVDPLPYIAQSQVVRKDAEGVELIIEYR